MSIPWWINHKNFSGFSSIYRVFGLLTVFLPVLILSNYGSVSYLLYDRQIIEGLYQVAGFILSAGAVGLGIKKNWSEVVNTGNTFFVIFLYTKFYDWWWDIMPKYLFFLLVGLTAVLILMAFKRVRSESNVLLKEVGP